MSGSEQKQPRVHSESMYYGIGWLDFFDEKFLSITEFSGALYHQNRDDYAAYRAGFMAAAESVGANKVPDKD